MMPRAQVVTSAPLVIYAKVMLFVKGDCPFSDIILGDYARTGSGVSARIDSSCISDRMVFL